MNDWKWLTEQFTELKTSFKNPLNSLSELLNTKVIKLKEDEIKAKDSVIQEEIKNSRKNVKQTITNVKLTNTKTVETSSLSSHLTNTKLRKKFISLKYYDYLGLGRPGQIQRTSKAIEEFTQLFDNSKWTASLTQGTSKVNFNYSLFFLVTTIVVVLLFNYTTLGILSSSLFYAGIDAIVIISTLIYSLISVFYTYKPVNQLLKPENARTINTGDVKTSFYQPSSELFVKDLSEFSLLLHLFQDHPDSLELSSSLSKNNLLLENTRHYINLTFQKQQTSLTNTYSRNLISYLNSKYTNISTELLDSNSNNDILNSYTTYGPSLLHQYNTGLDVKMKKELLWLMKHSQLTHRSNQTLNKHKDFVNALSTNNLFSPSSMPNIWNGSSKHDLTTSSSSGLQFNNLPNYNLSKLNQINSNKLSNCDNVVESLLFAGTRYNLFQISYNNNFILTPFNHNTVRLKNGYGTKHNLLTSLSYVNMVVELLQNNPSLVDNSILSATSLTYNSSNKVLGNYLHTTTLPKLNPKDLNFTLVLLGVSMGNESSYVFKPSFFSN